MTSADLLKQLTKNKELFIEQWTTYRTKEPPFFFDFESSLFIEDLFIIYYEELIGSIDTIYLGLKDRLQQDLEFYSDPRLKERFCFSEIKILKKEFESQDLNVLFDIENFPNQLFEMETLEKLVFNTINDKIYELYDKEPKVHVHLEKIQDIISNRLYELREVTEILIKLKLVHCEVENNLDLNKNEDPVLQKKEKNDLSLNQKVHLIEKLISSTNWSSLTQIRQAEIISLITGQNKDNARKALRKLNKKPSERSNQEQEDYEIIKELTKDLDLISV